MPVPILQRSEKMLVGAASIPVRRHNALRYAKKAVKRLVPLSLAVVFIPKVLLVYICCGLADVLRNQERNLSTLQRYFGGNGVLTWLLSPFNLLMDVISLPFWNRRVYQLTDLPQAYQDEINAIIETAQRIDLVGLLEAKAGGQKRGMIFFKWFGKNLQTSIDVPDFHRRYKYIRTIGVSIFNKRQSTGRHFGPLRITLRVLYNINDTASKNVYIQVGKRVNYWRENKLFIFDDTLQHLSCNESDEIRYCLFLDILRPSPLPVLTSAILACTAQVIARFNSAFYRNWTFIK